MNAAKVRYLENSMQFDYCKLVVVVVSVIFISPPLRPACSSVGGQHRNADRERNRVKSLRTAFQTLQSCIPSVPPDTKLSKLDILILATNYIAQLSALLENDNAGGSGAGGCSNPTPVSLAPNSALMSLWAMRSHRYLKFYHPIKKWPMRRRLYGHFEHGDQMSAPDYVPNAAHHQPID